MKTTTLLSLLGLVSVISSSACATFVRTPVYESGYAPVYTPVYAPARTVVVERDEPYYAPSVYHTTYVTRSAPSVVYVHSRGRPDCDDNGGGYVVHNGNAYGYSRGNYGGGSGGTVVVVNNGGGHDGGHDNGRGNNYTNNGHGNGDNHGRGNGNGNGHSRGRG